MAEDTRRLVPIPLSDLPIINDNETDKYWVFGSTEEKNGTYTSGRYNLKQYLEDSKKNLQLQRRIGIAMERDEQVIPIGETMVLFYAKARNVSKLEYRPFSSSDAWIEIPLNKDIGITLPDTTDIVVRIKRTTINSMATIYLFAKITETKL